jgi:hypothetical protein
MKPPRTRYGLVKSLLAEVPDPSSVMLSAFAKTHGLKYNSAAHAAKRLNLKFKPDRNWSHRGRLSPLNPVKVQS